MLHSIFRAYREAYGGLPNEIWVLSLALFINRCGAMVMAFLTLYLTNRLGFTMIEAGWILSVFGFGSLAGSYLGGKLTKPLGAVRTQIIGQFLAVPCYMLVPYFSSWTGVAVMVFLFSITSESIRPANHVATAQFTDPDKTPRAFGLQRMAVNLGFAFGPAIGGFLAEIDFYWLFVVNGLTTGMGGLILLWCFGFRKYAKSASSAEKQKQAERTSSHGSPWGDKKYFLFLGILMGVGLVFFQVHATYPKYLQEYYSLSKPMIGILFSINTVIIVVFEMLLVNYLQTKSVLRVIAWGAFFSCFGFFVLPFHQAFWFSVVSMSRIKFGEMLCFTIFYTFVAKRSTQRDQSAYMRWYAM
ncbi:MAG: MFS transporter, partial [Planctomycetota bacterium]